MAAQAQEMQTSDMCEVDSDIKGELKKIRFRRSDSAAAITLKIIVKENRITIDENIEECDIEEVQEALPDTQPRYLVYSYDTLTTCDGKRKPLMFIYYHPDGCNTNQQMRYAGCLKQVLKLFGSDKSFTIKDKEELTEEWIIKKHNYRME